MADPLADLQAQRNEELGRHFQELVSTSEGLYAAILSDREGVQLTKSISSDAPEKIIDSQITTTFAAASGHASKMGIGKNHTITALYSLYQVVQTTSRSSPHGQLVITLLADASANTGILIGLAEQLAEAIKDFSEALKDVE